MKRTFKIGEEWIYYKLYCGPRTADALLVKFISPLAKKLIEKSLIIKWFFIRYKDPDHHLRLRFYCEDTSKFGLVIKEINKDLKYFIDNDFIWKVQLEMYQRELERYDKSTIDLFENLFFHDSVVSVNAINLIDNDDILFIFMLLSINDLLISFDYKLNSRLNFVKHNLADFKLEFNSDKRLTKKLNKKYQALRNDITSFMNLEVDEGFNPLIKLIEYKNCNNQPSINKILLKEKKGILDVKLDSLVSSCIHMMINRQFRDKQRLFELVCYDFLSRYYSGVLAINKNNK
jgi:thiopeptide-type bacteriocin biosynthesis protein